MRNPVSQYTIRVCIRYKHIRDTIKACNRKQQAWGPYTHGQIEPHFQVPAVITQVEWHPWQERSPFHNSITWTERRFICDGCAGLVQDLVAIVDYNFDRCMDFSYKVGVYVNGREMQEGMNKYFGRVA